MPPEDSATKPPAAPRPSTESLVEPLARLRGELDRLYEALRARLPHDEAGRFAASPPAPAVDMVETEAAYALTAELPGLAPGDIHLGVEGFTLILVGEKKAEALRDGERRSFYAERSYGAFERRIALPAGADVGNARATLRRGVLHLVLPRTATAEAGRRRIAVEEE